MVKVAQRGRYSVYIYAEEGNRHHLPHCHVRWSDGYASVQLGRVRVIEGDSLPRAARELIDEHYDQLVDTWNLLNPGRPVQ